MLFRSAEQEIALRGPATHPGEGGETLHDGGVVFGVEGGEVEPVVHGVGDGVDAVDLDAFALELVVVPIASSNEPVTSS